MVIKNISADQHRLIRLLGEQEYNKLLLDVIDNAIEQFKSAEATMIEDRTIENLDELLEIMADSKRDTIYLERLRGVVQKCQKL